MDALNIETALPKKKVMLSCIFGNALEFYDFTLYGVLSGVLAGHYFPGDDDTAKLLFSLMAFAIGFLTRPLGAILFGHIGDTFGRKEALSLSILCMGIPTFIIGITPSYPQIGLWASFVIFACRLLQGIFTGGEYNGAAIFSIEHLGKKFPGFIGGLITSSCVIGGVMATLFGIWTQQEGMPDWSWRIPFIFGGVLGVFGYIMRRNMPETPEFVSSALRPRTTLFKALSSNFRASLISFIFGSFNGALTYTFFGFLNIYLSRYLNIPLSEAMLLNLFGLFAFMLGSPYMGYLFDTIGQKVFLITALLSIFSFLLPIFMLFSSEFLWAMILGQILFGLCVASVAGTGHAAMQSLFPVENRYRGIAFNFSLGMGLFGGITPIIYIEMIERHHMSILFPAFFLMGLTILSGTTLTLLKFFKTSTWEKAPSC